MIAAVYLVSLTETTSGGGTSSSSSSGNHGDATQTKSAILLHRRYCPSANAAGSVAVVEKFFGVARALTAEALAAASSASSSVAEAAVASSNGADTKLESDRSNMQSNGGEWRDTSAADLSPWSLKVLPPVVETDVAYVVYRRISDGVLLLASCQVETPPVMLVEFLKVFHDTLAFYVGAEKLTSISLPNAASFGAGASPPGGKLSLGNVTSVVSSIANRDGGAGASAQLVVLAAQLLDEMVDGGFPVQTELSILKSLIAPPTIIKRVASAVTGQNYSVSDALPELADNNIPWRRTNVKYASNEIYFDIEEQIDAVFDPAGMLVTCDVHGIVNVNSKLSGFPDLLATLTVRAHSYVHLLAISNPDMCDTFGVSLCCLHRVSDPKMMQFPPQTRNVRTHTQCGHHGRIQDSTVVEDARFHQCVRYSRWLADRVLSFVPPDGVSTLMEYRVARRGSGAVIPIFVRPQIDYSGSTGRISVMVGLKQDMGTKPVESIVVSVPLPAAAAHVDIKSNNGNVEVDMVKRICRWTISRLTKESPSPCLNGTLSTGDASAPMAAGVASLGTSELATVEASSETSDEAPVITVNFTVPGVSVSGLGIASLSLSNESYKLFKGFKLTTRAGKFEIRT